MAGDVGLFAATNWPGVYPGVESCREVFVPASAGLARGSRSGRENIRELDPERLDAARQCIERLSTQWDEALARLKQLVEG